MAYLTLAAGYVKDVEGVRGFADSEADELGIGSYTLLEREGNPEPTFEETEPGSGSFFNSVGMKNKSISYVEAHLDEMIEIAGPKQLRFSLAPLAQGDLKKMIPVFRGRKVKIEINTDCPNIWYKAGTQKPLICHDLYGFEQTLVEVVEARGDLYIAVKLSGLPDYLEVPIIELCHFYGMDEVVKMNTRPNVPAVDRHGKQLLAMLLAGLSGRAIHEEAVAEVRKTRNAIDSIPSCTLRLGGCGGVSSFQDVLDFEEAGADAGVQVASYTFKNGPQAMRALRAV